MMLMKPDEIADSLRCLYTDLKTQLDEALADIRKIADMVEAMGHVGVPDLPKMRFRSQWDDDAYLFKSDCGPACLAMLLEWRGVLISINDISLECGLSENKKYTVPADLIYSAKKHGLELDAVRGWTLEQFAARCPAIVLVHYGTFMDRQDQKYTGGHWLLLLGVYENQAIYHDPNWNAPRRNEGAARSADIVRFALAMHDCVMDGNSAGLGLVIH
jgi:hypothetical protein